MTGRAGGSASGDPTARRVGPPTAAAETVVTAETVHVGTEWVVSGQVRLRRRIVTTRRTVEVEVRREVLEVECADVDIVDGRLHGVAAGPVLDDVPPHRAPIVMVLHEEVARVVHEIHPYERVTVTTDRVSGTVTVSDVVRRDVVDVDVIPSPRED